MNARATPNLKTLGQADFERQVLRTDGKVLVAFWAPWSKPCQLMTSVLAEVAAGCVGQAEVAMVNADENPTLSLGLGVQHIPAFFLFEGGRMHGHLVGTTSKETILNLILGRPDRSARDISNREGEAI